MKRVGIFAGTFDPIHEGHLAFAHQALNQAKLDKVFFLVEPRPRRKQGVRALEHREHMVQLSIADEPRFGSIILEQQRFTVTDTLPTLKARFKGAELYLLMGDDVLRHLTEWPHVEELVQNVHFIIGVREDTSKDLHAYLQAVQRIRGFRLNYTFFDSAAPAFASSYIRLSLKRGHHPKGLPGTVYDYIVRNKLYASPSSS